jgi:hypothetical protein
MLARQIFCHLSDIPNPFYFTFQVGSCTFAWDWPQIVILLPYASCILLLVGWDGVLLIFCPV